MSYYGSPDDSRRAWLPRGVVVIAFSLALLSVILLPLDIANDRFDAGMNFGLGILWQVELILAKSLIFIDFL
jgi:hypothetical protein